MIYNRNIFSSHFVTLPLTFTDDIASFFRSCPTKLHCIYTARKVSKYEVISGPYFPVIGLNKK